MNETPSFRILFLVFLGNVFGTEWESSFPGGTFSIFWFIISVSILYAFSLIYWKLCELRQMHTWEFGERKIIIRWPFMLKN